MTLAMELRRREKISHEEGRAEGRVEGLAEGRDEREKEIILNMASMQMPAEVIAKAVRSTPEFIEKVLNRKAP